MHEYIPDSRRSQRFRWGNLRVIQEVRIEELYVSKKCNCHKLRKQSSGAPPASRCVGIKKRDIPQQQAFTCKNAASRTRRPLRYPPTGVGGLLRPRGQAMLSDLRFQTNRKNNNGPIVKSSTVEISLRWKTRADDPAKPYQRKF
jgi:hypothetical protein